MAIGEGTPPESDGEPSSADSAQQHPEQGETLSSWARFSRWATDRLHAFRAWLNQRNDNLATWWHVNAERRRAFERRLLRALELIGWAPTSLLLAALGGALMSLLINWQLPDYWDFGVDTGKLLLGITAGAAFLIIMFWFALSPRVITTAQRFWALLKLEIGLLGAIGLYLAATQAVDYFRETIIP